MRKLLTISSMLMGLALSGCGIPHQLEGQTLRIIESDSRIEISAEDPLLLSLGTINFGQYPICTGYLSSSNEAVTAKHCFENSTDLYNLSFINGLGEKFEIEGLSYHPNPLSDSITAEIREN